MPSLNRVMLIGHLDRNPETLYAVGGHPVANVWLQVKKRLLLVTFYGRGAETVSLHLRSGMTVYVEGQLYHCAGGGLAVRGSAAKILNAIPRDTPTVDYGSS